MPPKDPNKAHAALALSVKSKILERIQANLTSGIEKVAETTFVKSGGTNYGMYTKNDDNAALVNIWEKVFPASAGDVAATAAVRAASRVKKGGG